MKIISICSILIISIGIFAHSGRTNSSGCHNDRKNGGYHCHGSSYSERRSIGSTSLRKSKKVQFSQYCCKICRTGKACGDTCISKKDHVMLGKAVPVMVNIKDLIN